ncbi:MAG: hypothetical protein V4678_00215 [Patescibacteria group bacterium]
MSENLRRHELVQPDEYLEAMTQLDSIYVSRKYTEVVVEAAQITPGRFFHTLDYLSRQLHKSDEQVRGDAEKSWQAKMALRLGGLTAYTTLIRAYDPYAFSDEDIFGQGCPIEYEDAEGEEAFRNFRNAAMQFAEAGYETIGRDAEAIAHGWMEDMVREPGSQSYFRTGFGLVVHNSAIQFDTMLAEQQSADFKSFATEVNATDDRDWNELLRQAGE